MRGAEIFLSLSGCISTPWWRLHGQKSSTRFVVWISFCVLCFWFFVCCWGFWYFVFCIVFFFVFCVFRLLFFFFVFRSFCILLCVCFVCLFVFVFVFLFFFFLSSPLSLRLPSHTFPCAVQCTICGSDRLEEASRSEATIIYFDSTSIVVWGVHKKKNIGVRLAAPEFVLRCVDAG